MYEKILITGGAGFIGSFLVERLLDSGREVAVLDDFSTGRRENLAAVGKNEKLQIFTGDVTTDTDLVDRLVAEADAVIHLAAAVGVELVVDDPARTISTNVRGSENVFFAAAKHHKRLIAASTSEVYGKSEADFFRETDDLHLGSPYNSRWSYACSKLLDEFLLMALCRNARLQGTIVRFFNTVGPRQTGRYGMVLPRFVRAALDGKALRVYGDGRQTRCFCHVSDTVSALMLLLENEKSFGKIYNIGSSEMVTIGDLAHKVIAICGGSSAIENIPYDQAYAAGFEDMRHRRPDTTALKELTGWQTRYDLTQIIEDIRVYMSKSEKII